MIGELLGSYRIVQKLGAGGMGEVYLAEHQVIDRKVAIKVLRAESSANPSLVNRFFAEARSADSIKHPGIVQILDCAMPVGGRAYIVMEHLEGETLAATLSRVGLVEDSATLFEVSSQLAEALAAAHAKGIVHRDLKPDNVFLTIETTDRGRRTRVKVLDFGIAKLTYHSQVGQTQTGSLLGTPLYMSPEQARGARKVDHRSDIYSLGCIMFEMICGRPPFVREGMGDLLIAHVSEIAPSAASLQTALPIEIDRLVSRMLAKDPEERPQSMGEVLAALSVFRVRSSVQAETRDLPRPWASRDAPLGARLPGEPTPDLGPSGMRSTAGQVGGTRLLNPPSTLASSASEIGDVRTRAVARRSRKSIIFGACLLLGGVAISVALPLLRQRVPESDAGATRAPTLAPAAPAAASLKVMPVAPRVPSIAAGRDSAPALPTSREETQAATAARSDHVASPRASTARRRSSSAPDSPTLAAARAAYASGDLVAASVQAKRAVREGGGAAAFVLLGDSLAKLEQTKDAIEAYNAALEIDPDNGAARSGLRRAKKLR